MEPKILVIGDSVAPYHPLSNLSVLREVLYGYALTLTDDHEMFLRLREFAVCLCYLDSWEQPLSAGQSEALESYLWNGGKLLYIHNGISLQITPSLSEVLGARFAHHPPAGELTIQPVRGHPLTEESPFGDLPRFTVFDEPYHYEFSAMPRIFATYEYNGSDLPAAWESAYGGGTLIHLMPGHDTQCFLCGAYQTWIRRCVEYLCHAE